MKHQADTLISSELLEKVKWIAKEEKRMPSEVIKEALERYVEEQRSYRQDIAHRPKSQNNDQSVATILDLSTLLQEVNDAADEENRSAGELMREAVRQFLDQRRMPRDAK